jgi:hypothetical protein
MESRWRASADPCAAQPADGETGSGGGTREGVHELVERAQTTAEGPEHRRTRCERPSRPAGRRREESDRETPGRRGELAGHDHFGGGVRTARSRGEAAGDSCGTPSGSTRHRSAKGRPDAFRCTSSPTRARLQATPVPTGGSRSSPAPQACGMGLHGRPTSVVRAGRSDAWKPPAEADQRGEKARAQRWSSASAHTLHRKVW